MTGKPKLSKPIKIFMYIKTKRCQCYNEICVIKLQHFILYGDGEYLLPVGFYSCCSSQNLKMATNLQLRFTVGG